jgi:2-aminoethylphosphonate dioxygenase
MIFLRAFFLCMAMCCFAVHSNDVWQDQKEFFQQNGYLKLEKFFSEEQVKLLNSLTDEIISDSKNILSLMQQADDPLQLTKIPGALIVVPEAKDPLIACRAEDMLSCYPDLHRFISGTISSYISRLMDDPYVLFKDKINFKWPGGGAFLPHQDYPAYEPFAPKSHITAMICIDAATLENGCLRIAQNWKETFAEEIKNGKKILPYIIGGKSHGAIKKELTDRITWIPLTAEPGDVLIFSSYVPHYSEPNMSKNPRRAMFFTHNRLLEGEHRSAYYRAKRNDPNNPVFHIGTPTKARTKD